MPANAGAAAEVPPIGRKPKVFPGSVVQSSLEPVLSTSSVQIAHKAASAPFPDISEMSGTSRKVSLGTPVPRCQDGLAYPLAQVPVLVLVEQLLMPPLPATI